MKAVALAAACVVVTACSGAPTSPTVEAARTGGRLSRTRFMAFGDSITVGEVTAPIGGERPGAHTLIAVPAASYPSQLQSMLRSRYPSQASDITVANAGVGGESVVTGVLRFDEALDEHRPQVVLLMEGANGLTSIGVDASAALIRAMTQAAKNRSMRVFIGSMLPTIAGRQRTQNVPALEAYNARLRELCTLEGVTFVDLYETLLPEVLDVIGIDGLHPTEAGYRRVAEVFFAAIRADLEVR